MKKLLILSLLAASASTTLADYNGTGYYRVQNYKTTRWISIIDNKGSMDVGSTTFDLGAVQLQKNWDEVCCDPASILYIYPHSGKYQIEAQGTGINQISNRYIDISEAGTGADGKLYYAYGTENGMLKYIGDGELIKKKDKTIAVTNATGDYRKWYIKPVTGDGSCYLGVKTTVNAGGKHYATMYASFPMKPYSDGVKAYVVNTVDQGMAVLDEVTDVIGANTPVVFECATDSPNTNRLTVGGKGSAYSSNRMRGVYFNNSVNTHLNRVAYDPNTMRILGTCSDGSLGFITATGLDYIPANTAYLSVAAGTPAELKCVTRAEYDAYVADVEDIIGEDGPVDVFNLQGMSVLRQAMPDEINALPAGIYIANGKKILVRR